MRTQNVKSLTRKTALLIVLLIVTITSATLTLSLTAKNHSHSSVTGYFGLDDEGIPIVDRHGIMLVFDGAIAPETVSAATFDVFHDESSQAEVVDAHVDGAYVFLKLKEELASDATPVLMIVEGEEVEDLAGNSTNRRKLGAVRIKDGIAPRLTVALSGGSGTGTGDEGPNRLTNNTIDIRITSDEPLQGTPRIVVVCPELSWVERSSDGDIPRDIDDFIANRNGPFPRKPSEPPDTVYTCGYDVDGDGNDDDFNLTEDIAHSRPGEVWEYTWRNPAGAARSLRDGELVVVAYGRDRSRYDRYDETVSNWSTATAGFGLDTPFGSKDRTSKSVRVHPPDGSTVREERPFVLLEFPESSTVTLSSVILDNVEIADQFSVVRGNEFVYWPLSMNQGEHKVEVIAIDAAGNSLNFGFGFTSTQRGDFVIDLVPGWNAISVPSDPVEPSVRSVFSESGVEAVIAWAGSMSDGPWSIAIRQGGEWKSLSGLRALTKIREGVGYWMKSSEFTKQSVELRPTAVKSDLSSIIGWNFLGVVDENGNQTQNHNGVTLKDENGDHVLADTYLGEYTLAFTWDPIARRFEPLTPETPMTIGDGIWVYYSEMGSE